MCNAINQMGRPWEIQSLALLKARIQMQEFETSKSIESNNNPNEWWIWWERKMAAVTSVAASFNFCHHFLLPWDICRCSGLYTEEHGCLSSGAGFGLGIWGGWRLNALIHSYEKLISESSHSYDFFFLNWQILQ